MSDPDDIDEVFRNLRGFAENEPDPFDIDDSTFHDVPQLETDDPNAPEDELILGEEYVTYIIYADGRGVEDFLVLTDDDSIEVKSEDFNVKKELGLQVEREDPRTTYANGVLSVRLRRAGPRDAVG